MNPSRILISYQFIDPNSLFCQAFVLKEGSQVPLITGVISMPCTDIEPVSQVSTKNKDLFE